MTSWDFIRISARRVAIVAVTLAAVTACVIAATDAANAAATRRQQGFGAAARVAVGQAAAKLAPGQSTPAAGQAMCHGGWSGLTRLSWSSPGATTRLCSR